MLYIQLKYLIRCGMINALYVLYILLCVVSVPSYLYPASLPLYDLSLLCVDFYAFLSLLSCVFYSILLSEKSMSNKIIGLIEKSSLTSHFDDQNYNFDGNSISRFILYILNEWYLLCNGAIKL